MRIKIALGPKDLDLLILSQCKNFRFARQARNAIVNYVRHQETLIPLPEYQITPIKRDIGLSPLKPYCCIVLKHPLLPHFKMTLSHLKNQSSNFHKIRRKKVDQLKKQNLLGPHLILQSQSQNLNRIRIWIVMCLIFFPWFKIIRKDAVCCIWKKKNLIIQKSTMKKLSR